MKARVVRFHQIGGPDVLKIETVDVPSPGPGEVRIQVKALGLNRGEAMYRAGRYLEQPQFPSRLGYEAAGTVESIGANVEGLKVGDAVSTAPAFSQNPYGVYGEIAVVPAAAVMKHPAFLSWPQAAALWAQYLTAYGALVSIADIKAGETVLIPAASSSVGIASVQIANMIGAIPIGLTRTAVKRQALLEMGFRHVIVTEEQDVVAEVRRATSGRGARVVFDPVGGPTAAKLSAIMAPRGIMIVYGAMSAQATPLPVTDVISKSLMIRGYVLFEVSTVRSQLRRAERFIVDGLTSGKLKPVIARTFALDQIVEAHRYLEANAQIGKVVVNV